MKRIILCLPLSLCMLFCYAQNELPVSLQLKGGISIPVGMLGESQNVKSGFAQIGKTLGATLFLNVSPNVDMAFGFMNSSMAINRSKYDPFAEKLLRKSLDSTETLTRNFNYKSTFGSYSNQILTVGINFDLPINTKVLLFVNPAITYSWFNIPDISIIVKDSSFSYSASQSTTAKPTIGFYFGGGVKLNTNERLQVIFEAAYINSNHEFTTQIFSVNQNNTPMKGLVEDEYIFAAINISVGLQFRLNK